MCGIAGIYNYREPERPVDRDLLVRMTRTLQHRGPDAEGFYVNGCIGLGHRRLSIVDLSPNGSQPMSNDDKSCWITYNGEFYNHGSFRSELLSRGHRFRGSSDTETLLHLVEEKGPEALAEASGIFGFGFWDGRSRTLILARDALGVKQVYFHDDGERIVFASEIKALLVCPDVPRSVDTEAVNQYVHFHTAISERTFLRDVEQVRAGEYLLINRYGATRRRYWALTTFGRADTDIRDITSDLQQRLEAVVQQQLMADVPVGSFFSGGIDSSAIAAFAARAGKRPKCFGIHFSDQGVVDERPYQEAAAKALGLELNLTSINGSSFPDDLRRLIYHQDQPVIGAAMFPMYYVSRLAAREVKVCLGGQAADEIFGGYARYALAHPSSVIGSWFTGRTPGVSHRKGHVGGNLGRQLRDRRNLGRLLSNVRNVFDWEARYFDNFAIIPEATWHRLVAPELVNRDQCLQLFHESIRRSPANDPADKIMHWDLQTYLTGLFQQDDRMSMAVGLESRVPFADPKLVQFAFQLGFDLKFRGGATKWILRKAVADVLPAVVLNRRKVGFDTPTDLWLKTKHAGFVRELLLSARARERGWWRPTGIDRLLTHTDTRFWTDIVWKLAAVEMWASVFLDSAQTDGNAACAPEIHLTRPPSPDTPARETCGDRSPHLRDRVQEVRELGARRTAARVSWEFQMRSGLKRLDVTRSRTPASQLDISVLSRMFTPPTEVAELMKGRIDGAAQQLLSRRASDATRGRIQAFSRWSANYGAPIDWHLNPQNGKRWRADLHWSKATGEENRVGDVKFTWEIGRFPHAYDLARGATFEPGAAPFLGKAFGDQCLHFEALNPYPYGVHWSSGQEIAFRLMAWFFGAHVFTQLGALSHEAWESISRSATLSAKHIQHNIDYARDSVYNNHLLSEALGLYIVGALTQGSDADEWRRTGSRFLTEQASIQIYPDGGYIQQSHNYQRVAIKVYLWAVAAARAYGDSVPAEWLDAIRRSSRFLYAHQNPSDGRLPNYGANDGALPSGLSSCDFSDFRPVLQTANVLTDGTRLYPSGPWDEMGVWLLGGDAADAPVHEVSRTTVSFHHSGYHVLRGRSESTFAAFRCGSVLDRFSQIDMLHVDFWWRGHNVLVDGGSYLYNGPAKWHDHFLETGIHNTIELDGRDQMLHFRRFKSLYWTQARLVRFEDHDDYALAEGEHYGYGRHPGRCVHNRSLLFFKDDVLVVVDRISGSGRHSARLHWLCGAFSSTHAAQAGRLSLHTPAGEFTITVLNASGEPFATDVASGQTDPPRGWMSRYYGEKIPVPSLAAVSTGTTPLVLVSVLAAGSPVVRVQGEEWEIDTDNGVLAFTLHNNGSLQYKQPGPVNALCTS